jgi:hypothetical protein
MKATVEPTGNFESVGGMQCRMWKGTTEGGVEFELFVPLVRVRSDGRQVEFQELVRVAKADRTPRAFDSRLIT